MRPEHALNTVHEAVRAANDALAAANKTLRFDMRAMGPRGFVKSALIGLFFAVWAGAPALAQGDRLEQARQVVRVAYPDLVGESAWVLIPLSLDQPWISSRIPTLRLLVYRAGHPGSPAPEDLVVHYEPDAEGRPKIMVVSGPHVEFERLGELRAEVNRNQEWSDTIIRSRLETAGATFASLPASEVLRAVNMERFRPLLGDFRVIDTEFVLREDAEDINHRSAILTWTVRTELPRGNHVRGYVFTFEPFAGRLLAIRQMTATGR